MIDRNRLLFPQLFINCEVKSPTKQVPFHYIELGSIAEMEEKLFMKADTLVPENHFLVKIEFDGGTEYYQVVSKSKLEGTLKVNGETTIISCNYNPEEEGNIAPEKLLTLELEQLFQISEDYAIEEVLRESPSEDVCKNINITYNIVGQVTREKNKLIVNYEDGTVLELSELTYTGCHKELCYHKSITAQEYETGKVHMEPFDEEIPF